MEDYLAWLVGCWLASLLLLLSLLFGGGMITYNLINEITVWRSLIEANVNNQQLNMHSRVFPLHKRA